MMLPTDILQREHRVIERMLRILEHGARELSRGENAPVSLFEKILDFISNFSDRCHHGKEEDILFPVLEGRGIPRYGGPIGVMLSEHEEGRKLVRNLREFSQRYGNGDAAARTGIIENAFLFVELLSRHIYKEDDILYPMANRVLSVGDQQDLLEKFEAVERDLGEGVHQHYVKLVEDLEAEYLLESPGIPHPHDDSAASKSRIT